MTDPCADSCACHQNSSSLAQRWGVTVLFIGTALVLLRPLIVGQMLVRVTSYSASSFYTDVIRICKKIITIDSHNKQAWVSLGYAYMDLSQKDKALAVFEKVLLLDGEDKGAASFELGQIYYAKGDFPKAIECFQRVRSAGPRRAALLDADILKYRHGILGFRSLNSMKILLKSLLECYRQTGDTTRAAQIQKEYDLYKNKHKNILF